MKTILATLITFISVNALARSPVFHGQTFCGKVISLEKSILRMEHFNPYGESLGEGDIVVTLVPEPLLNIARIAMDTNQKYCLVISYLPEVKSKAWITTMDENTLQ